jgi:hypothetical protein
MNYYTTKRKKKTRTIGAFSPSIFKLKHWFEFVNLIFANPHIKNHVSFST